MGYAQFLRALLQPLGVYDLTEHSFSGAQVEALGTALDAVETVETENFRESVVLTAEDSGLDTMEALFRKKPAASSTAERRAAIGALLQISGDSFTPASLSACLAGCGTAATVTETGSPDQVLVAFQNARGVPASFDALQKIIEDILPCHLEILYQFIFLTWVEAENAGLTWADISELTWRAFEAYDTGV